MYNDANLLPETKVLAVASHVVHGYVGNSMAATVLRFLGCEVSAINTVQFSNGTAYDMRLKGTETKPQELRDIWDGLQQNGLDEYDCMLSGFAPNAQSVEVVGEIAKALKIKAKEDKHRFCWALDPVMGDDGELYVQEDVVPVYKQLLNHADLILPNQFELEVLTESKITSPASLRDALQKLHVSHGIPHIVVTSLDLPSLHDTGHQDQQNSLIVVGSSRNSSGEPRAFKISVTKYDCFYSGTGDLFAALLLPRLRAISLEGSAADDPWAPPADDVPAIELHLAQAAQMALASMAVILKDTQEKRDYRMANLNSATKDKMKHDESFRKVVEAKLAEVNVVRYVSVIQHPSQEDIGKTRIQPFE